jgi:hypothetical protein
MFFEMAGALVLMEIYFEGLLAVWKHGMVPAVVATLNMMSLMVAHLFVAGLYPIHDTVACIFNGTGVLACARLHPLFDHRANVTHDMLDLHHTIQSVAAATVQGMYSYYWEPQHVCESM